MTPKERAVELLQRACLSENGHVFAPHWPQGHLAKSVEAVDAVLRSWEADHAAALREKDQFIKFTEQSRDEWAKRAEERLAEIVRLREGMNNAVVTLKALGCDEIELNVYRAALAGREG